MVPVVMLITFPLFTLTHILQEPNGAFAVGASLFPFATPMLMMTRLATAAGRSLVAADAGRGRGAGDDGCCASTRPGASSALAC